MKAKKSNKSKLIKLLDTAWSEYIHKRDKVCQVCGGSGALSAHHAFGRRNMNTRFDVENGVLLCFPHHFHYAHRDVCSFAEWFKKHIGVEQYERLSEARNMVVKFTSDDLTAMLKTIKEME